MSGINEWLQEGEHSKYQTPRPWRWWTWLLIGFVLGMAVMLPFTKAHASPSCMTFSEARELHPNEYLAWHGEHCWYARGRSEHRHAAHIPIPKEKPFILLLEQSEPQEWIYADRWWLS
jgi:hypothetical protein